MGISRAIVVLLCAFASTAYAADRIWTGNAPSSPKRWTDRFNWEGNVAPTTGDRLIFPATSSAKASFNDFPGYRFNGLVFTDPAGHTITTDIPPLSLEGPLAIVVEATGGTFSVGPIALPSNSSLVTVNRPPGAPAGEAPVLMPGVIAISQGNRFEATTGRIVLSEAVNFPEYPPFGGMTIAGNIELRTRTPYNVASRIEGGVVKVLSTNGAPTLTLWNGRLEFGPFFADEDPNYVDMGLYLTGPPEPELGNVTTVVPIFRGGMRVEGTQTFIGGPLTFASAIQGAGVMRLKVTGNSCATYSNTGNSFTGGIEVAQGALCILQEERIPDAVPVVIRSGGTLQLGAPGINHSSPIRETVRSLACAGRLSFLEAGMVSLRVLQPSVIDGCQLTISPGVSVEAANGITLVRNESGQAFVGAFTNAPEGAAYTVNGTPMRLTYHGGAGNDIALVATAPTGTPPAVQGMWWSGAAENGWGMSIVQHDAKLFLVIYGYDAAGAPTWWVIPEGTWNSALTEFTGSVYTPHGSRFEEYDATRFIAGPSVGQLKLTVASSNSARIDYTINGFTSSKQITQLAFGLPGPPGPPLIPGAGDMYWGGVAQNGWGISIAQQFNDLFAVWYTYDRNGSPTWFVMPHGNYVQGGGYEGRIFRATGSPWLRTTYDPSRFITTDAGSFRMRFSEQVFEYTIDDRTGSMPFMKTPF